MGFLRRLRGRFKPNGTIAMRQAGADPDWTPSPYTDDWGTSYEDTQSFLARQLNSPERIEWLWYLCDEWADVVHKVVGEVWRRGIEVVPVHDLLCDTCGEPVDDPDHGCAFCGDKEGFRPPDPAGRLLLEDLMQLASRTRNVSLVEVMQRRDEEMLKHGTGYLIKKFRYLVDESGVIKEAHLEAVDVASSAKMVRLRDPATGRPGGHWICISCRDTSRSSQKKPGPCDICQRQTYEAWFAERESINSGDMYRSFFLPNEVDDFSWPYRDGSPAIKRLENKAFFLVFADMYAAAAVDPKKPIRPGKIFVTMGGEEAAVEKWAKRDAAERKQDPGKMSHLHIPAPPGGLQDLKMAAIVVDMTDQHVRGHIPEIREAFTKRLRQHYGLSPIQGGETEGGGLNQEGLQLRTGSAVTQDIQNGDTQSLERLARQMGVFEWKYQFKPPLEEDEKRRLETTMLAVTTARQAADAGLRVRFVNGMPRISDGEVQPLGFSQLHPPITGGSTNPNTGIDAPTSPRNDTPPVPVAARKPSPGALGPATGASRPAGDDLQDQGLNGAQVSAILEVISQYTAGTLNRGSALAIIMGAFPFLNPATVEKMVPTTQSPEPVPPIDRVVGPRHSKVAQALRQAANNGIDIDDDLPAGVRAVLGGPSGAIEAQDALYTSFQGIDNEGVEKIRRAIVEAMSNKDGWSTKTISQRLVPIYVEAGFDEAMALHRARLVARMESRSIASELHLRTFRDEETERGRNFRYRLIGPTDHRTTKLSRWQRDQIPEKGLSLQEMEIMLDESIRLAKEGAFVPGGIHGNVPGESVRLPGDFQRRGFVTHFGDRDRVIRVHGGTI